MQGKGKRQTILIIDDLQENLRLLTEILQSQNYKIHPIRNAYRGLMVAHQQTPDLILLDIKMPDIDGFEVCQQLKADARTRDIPVIFISALDEVFDKLRAFQAGGVDYVTKPFQEAEVLARIETHLTIRQLQQNLEEKVQLRTAALNEANQQLQAEIERRSQFQAERDRLFTVVSQQSEQVRQMTTLLIEVQQTNRQDLAQGLRAEIAGKIQIALSELRVVKQLLPNRADPMAIHLDNATSLLDRAERYINQVTTDLPQPTAQEQALADNPLIKLSEREREVLQLVGDGKSTAEIADLLSVTAASVHTYKKRIRYKLDLPDANSLIRFAVELYQTT